MGYLLSDVPPTAAARARAPPPEAPQGSGRDARRGRLRTKPRRTLPEPAAQQTDGGGVHLDPCQGGMMGFI